MCDILFPWTNFFPSQDVRKSFKHEHSSSSGSGASSPAEQEQDDTQSQYAELVLRQQQLWAKAGSLHARRTREAFNIILDGALRPLLEGVVGALGASASASSVGEDAERRAALEKIKTELKTTVLVEADKAEDFFLRSSRQDHQMGSASGIKLLERALDVKVELVRKLVSLWEEFFGRRERALEKEAHVRRLSRRDDREEGEEEEEDPLPAASAAAATTLSSELKKYLLEQIWLLSVSQSEQKSLFSRFAELTTKTRELLLDWHAGPFRACIILLSKKCETASRELCRLDLMVKETRNERQEELEKERAAVANSKRGKGLRRLLLASGGTEIDALKRSAAGGDPDASERSAELARLEKQVLEKRRTLQDDLVGAGRKFLLSLERVGDHLEKAGLSEIAAAFLYELLDSSRGVIFLGAAKKLRENLANKCVDFLRKTFEERKKLHPVRCGEKLIQIADLFGMIGDAGKLSATRKELLTFRLDLELADGLGRESADSSFLRQLSGKKVRALKLCGGVKSSKSCRR